LDTKGIAKAATKAENYCSIELDPAIVSQLHDYVKTIASMYRNNPFHSFDHACHVTMSVSKLLKRIVSPDVGDNMDGKREQLATHLHHYTHGINSDPLTIFAVVFSALIHDVDHRGVSNNQLIKEQEDLASLYRNKSVAEQNSLDISWDLLMSDEYDELRCCLFATKEEMMRFRQAIVNVVLATDIFDQELNTLRTNRWQKAFSEEASKESFDDLRATIVLEHVSRIAAIDTCLEWLGFNGFPYSYFLFSSDIRSFKLRMLLILCNIGMYTANGTDDYSRNCTWPIVKEGWAKIHPIFGIKARFPSLRTTLFL
jgi:hypothetical protein